LRHTIEKVSPEAAKPAAAPVADGDASEPPAPPAG